MADLDTVIRERRSVRGFDRNRAVDRATLEDVLRISQCAPSNCNVQPWEVFIASGAALEALRSELLTAVDEGKAPAPLAPMDHFMDQYRKRQVACAVEMYGHMGIARDDAPGRVKAFRRNFEFFDAPHLAIVCMRNEFGIGVALDVGMWVQTFMLALWGRGIGSCAQASVRLFPDLIARHLSIDPNLQILCGISFGFEDANVPANNTRQPREPIETNVRFFE